MTKKSKNKAPKRKKAQKKQTWELNDTQKVLLTQALARHQDELQPILSYQKNQATQLLIAFRNELGIPEKMQMGYDQETYTFTEK